MPWRASAARSSGSEPADVQEDTVSQSSHLLPEVQAHYGRVRNYVDGDFQESRSPRSLPVVNPATGGEIATVPLSTRGETAEAIAAAQAAFPEWRETPPNLRVQPLFRLKALIEKHYEELARIVTQEHGKVIDEARGSVRRLVDNLDFACGIPSLLMGEYLEDGAAPGIDEESIRQPLGVFAGIVPFNFPAMVPFWFWPNAVACGNTYVVKPSEQVPITQSRIFEIIDEAGFPPGVINMVHGDREVAEVLLEDPRVKGISFVGSTPVSRIIYETAARHGKRVQCQGGAKNFLTVMPDANLAAVVPNIISSCYGNSGQRCLAGAVLLLVGDAGDEVARQVVEGARRLRVGNGLDETSQMGPVAAKRHHERILGMIDAGVREGAELVLDGRGVRVPGGEAGFFIGPTVFDRCTPEMTIIREEIFGPVISMIRVRDLDEAIAVANGSRFGNASSIYTTSGKSAREYKVRVQGGNIGINIGVPAPMAYFNFGGMKESFFGDLHAQGRDGINFFTERKVVITRWV
ncbi:MAG: CoA-acylating methylmalonate-semialdehyde dehydrogenase [Deltaproteobacteria bacterium]|nr:CoA-acylating methylmalonate-semialdehyde dehydrogenase [Deltaproteobacteria bacterium]